ncbi:MAG TPA: hypothetical protein VFF79_08640 [Conexibacter sp.]|jgi:hypothetical protein|nr:hypothetical protein [Conexibacter sp.]
MTDDGPTITTDPDGTSVELTAERWHHIRTGHPDLAPYRDAVMATISAPTIRRLGREPNERWHYLEDAGPSRWLKVVVAYEGSRGYVRTAFARRSFP